MENQQIPQELLELYRNAEKIPYEQSCQLVAAAYWDHNMMGCFYPMQLPTQPPLFYDFKKLSHREREERLDPESMRCKAYLYQAHKVRMNNYAVRTWVKSDLLPAFERMEHGLGIAKCRDILMRHEEALRYPGEEVISEQEAEARYK